MLAVKLDCLVETCQCTLKIVYFSLLAKSHKEHREALKVQQETLKVQQEMKRLKKEIKALRKRQDVIRTLNFEEARAQKEQIHKLKLQSA